MTCEYGIGLKVGTSYRWFLYVEKEFMKVQKFLILVQAWAMYIHHIHHDAQLVNDSKNQ